MHRFDRTRAPDVAEPLARRLLREVPLDRASLRDPDLPLALLLKSSRNQVSEQRPKKRGIPRPLRLLQHMPLHVTAVELDGSFSSIPLDLMIGA
nr:hypothetical protein [Phenylobacterium sp.]